MNRRVAMLALVRGQDEKCDPNKLVQQLHREKQVTCLQPFGSMTPTNNVDVSGRVGQCEVKNQIVFVET